jgi:hypothetical protein
MGHVNGADQIACPRVAHSLGYHHSFATAQIGVGI